MTGQAASSGKTSTFLVGAVVLFGLYLAKLHSYLLFHTLVEAFSVAVACGIFMIAWNSRRIMDNNYFLFVGIASFFVGAVDFVHTLAYKGMGVFPGYGPNLPTQLWIVARYLQGVSLLVAPLFLGRKLKAGLTIMAFLAATSLLLAAVFTGIFPDCFVEGVGLTPFKKGSEYLVCLLLLGAFLFMRRKMEAFDREVVRLLSTAITIFITTELAFTLYTDVYGISNMVGHFLKFAGFYYIYKALIEIGLTRPYDLLFRGLKQSEERYRHLYEDTPVMLHSIDREGRLISVSNYWLEHLGYERVEVIGRKSTDFFTEASRRYAEEVVLPKYFQTGYAKDVPYQILKKNGEIVDALLTAAVEWDAQGEITRSLAVMVDVTERKRAEEKVEILNSHLAAKADELEEANLELEAANVELEVANQELEEANRELETVNVELETFSHTVSHDLRAPLNNISGSCQVLKELYADRLDEQGERFITFIHEETKRMDTLIGALLNFSRMTRQEICREEVDLSSMASAIATALRMKHPERGVAFTIAEGVKCHGDTVLLRAVMENLLGNAWKYTGKQNSANIEFGMTESEGIPVYFIRDNGAGFDMGQAHRLFGAFQRLHDRSEFDGTGIGLATVQRIIQRHGGRAWAEGEPDKGATFYFALS